MPTTPAHHHHYLIHNAFKYLFKKSYQTLNQLKNQQKKYCFIFFNKMVTKKTQGLSFNLFLFCPKFPNFVSRAFHALRIFSTVLALNFLQLLDDRGFSYHCSIGFKNHPLFCSSKASFLPWMRSLIVKEIIPECFIHWGTEKGRHLLILIFEFFLNSPRSY